ncbi:unnamed protein product [Orchesella dallaii]|uniref:Uncharacterized protein n=1 Tax=Orchesella dallaii TaxID=48710 RepID=A0ABP1S0C8_9HEXA
MSPNENNFKLVSHQYSRFRDAAGNPIFPNSNPNIQISNLPEIIDKIPGCLHHIINYNGLNLKPTVFTPTVISRYDVVRVKYKVLGLPRNKTEYTGWTRSFPFEKIPSKQNVTTGLKWCQRRSILQDLECLDIPFIDNSPKTKSWTCEAHWYLFPPNPMADSGFYFKNKYDATSPLQLTIPGAYKRFWGIDNSIVIHDTGEDFTVNPGVLTKTKSIYDIIVTNMEPMNFITINAWSHSLSCPFNNVPGFQYTTTGREEFTFNLAKKTDGLNVNYQLTSAIHFCRHCKKFRTFYPVEFFDVSEQGIQNQIKISNSNPGNIHWGFLFAGEVFNAIDSDEDQGLFHVSPYKYILSEEFRTEATLEKSRIKSELRLLLQNVLGSNITYFLTHNGYQKADQNWQGEDAALLPNDVRKLPILVLSMVGKIDYVPFRFHSSHLKFVSCGQALFEQLAFEELSSIFDGYTWFSLLVSVTTMAFLAEYSLQHRHGCKPGVYPGKKNSNFLSFMAPMRALTEQGDPFTNDLVRITSLRPALGLFLLMTLVLSNAYKNKNITKITLPLAPIPFDNFDALVKYSFKTFTKVVIPSGFKDMWKYIPFPQLVSSLIETKRELNNHFSILLPSELYLYVMGEYSQLTYYVAPTNMSKKAAFLINHTSIHPQWKNILTTGRPRSLEIVGKCNNTALFMPDVEAHETYYKLAKMASNKGKVYLSQESLFETEYGVGFGRWVDPIVFGRMGKLHVAGLWNWWTHFYVEFMARLRGERVNARDEMEALAPKKSSLEGHISVVFIVYVVMILAIIIYFVFEINWTIFQKR